MITIERKLEILEIIINEEGFSYKNTDEEFEYYSSVIIPYDNTLAEKQKLLAELRDIKLKDLGI